MSHVVLRPSHHQHYTQCAKRPLQTCDVCHDHFLQAGAELVMVSEASFNALNPCALIRTSVTDVGNSSTDRLATYLENAWDKRVLYYADQVRAHISFPLDAGRWGPAALN